MRVLLSWLLDDAEGKVRYPGALDHPGALQFDLPRAQALEQTDAVPQQHGHQVYVYLVEEFDPDALLRDTGGTHGDVLIALDRPRSLDGALDAVRDERERRPS